MGTLRALFVAVLAGCSSVDLPEGSDRLQAAGTFLDGGQHDEALDLALDIIDPNIGAPPAPREKAEAHWIAAESALALERLELALKHYRELLEVAPWSPRTAAIEPRLYEVGTRLLTEDQYGGVFFSSRDEGVLALETLQIHFSRSELADDALLHVADHYASEEIDDPYQASFSYLRLYEQYADSEWAEKALFESGNQMLRLVAGPRYNREGLLVAAGLLSRSLREHPRGRFLHEARAALDTALEWLGEHHLQVAEFYAARANLEGELLRLENASRAYPETPAGREALARLRARGGDRGGHSLDKEQPTARPWDDPDSGYALLLELGDPPGVRP